MTVIKNDPSTYRLREKLAAAPAKRTTSTPRKSQAEVLAALANGDPHGYINWDTPVEAPRN